MDYFFVPDSYLLLGLLKRFLFQRSTFPVGLGLFLVFLYFQVCWKLIAVSHLFSSLILASKCILVHCRVVPIAPPQSAADLYFTLMSIGIIIAISIVGILLVLLLLKKRP
jgi:hypothetical protein